MASGEGSTTVDFGAWPGKGEASVDVSGQTGLTSAARIEVWVLPIATADHSADEHMIEDIGVRAKYKVDGTLTITAWDSSPPPFKAPQDGLAEAKRLYGQYTIGWVWKV